MYLPDDLISRNHAVIQRMGDGHYYLIDMGSRNGSFVNDTRVTVPRVLNEGDTISVGTGLLTFHSPASSARQPGQVVEAIDKTRVHFFPRLITVLVIDIRGFTKLAQELDQSVLCNLIAAFFSRSGAIVRARGSWSQKYIGDAIMAVWVHRSAEGGRAEIFSALRASTEIAEMTSKIATEFAFSKPIQVGAGLNTGFASIGNAGTGDDIDFTALGDTVNATFRIESSTKEIGSDLALGKNTYDYLRETAEGGGFFSRFEVSLKGYEDLAAVWGAPFAEVQRLLDTLPEDVTGVG